MTAEIEAEALGVDDRLGDAADLLVGFQDDDLLAGLGQQIPGGQAGGAAAQHDVRALGAVGVRDGGIDLDETHASSFPAPSRAAVVWLIVPNGS